VPQFGQINQHIHSATEVIGYGMSDQALLLAERMGIRMVHGHLLQLDAGGMSLQIHSSWGAAQLDSPLLGRFNAENLLGVLAALLASGITLPDAVRELSAQRALPGRMQTLGGNDRPLVVVDFAHTPDALEQVLHTLREVAGAGKVICVFGCGGDRDRGKRPVMGRVASLLAHECIITSDNPRSEAPQSIIDEIAAGAEGNNWRVIADRAAAIATAISAAHAADTVLLAGKGHEDYQEINGVQHHFSDVEHAEQALAAWSAT
jgi:UDP-N-acetylmuramoyl-L-alanyl-D-glutamate--2,6-diaminopimelate ligase